MKNPSFEDSNNFKITKATDNDLSGYTFGCCALFYGNEKCMWN